MMSRKDYRAFAEVIAAERSMARHQLAHGSADGETKLCVTRNIALSMADVFARDNPRFQRGRFYAACGIGNQYAATGEAGDEDPPISEGSAR